MADKPETRYARNGDVSLAYQVLGTGPRDLVFLQGFCSHLDLMWAQPAYVQFMRRLASFARVVLYDRRGTGLSDRFDRPASFDDQLGDLKAVLDAAGVRDPVIVGFSAGGALAVLYAATYPNDVAGLVLSEAMPSMRPGPGYLEHLQDEMETLIERFRQMSTDWGKGVLLEFFGPSMAGGSVQRRVVGLFERACATPDTATALLEDGLQLDVRSILPSIRVPTLVMHRRHDVIPIDAGRYLAEHIPGARFVELEGGDHMPWAGDHLPIAREIERFIRGETADVDSDRSLTALVFTSLAEADVRAAELGDAAFGRLMSAHDEAMRTELRRFSGEEIKHTGDGLVASFTGPSAAARFALAAVDAARQIGAEIRAGVHLGEVRKIAGEMGGVAVHVAARVMTSAQPGQVLATTPVRDLTTSQGLFFLSVGTHELRGVDGAWELFEVGGDYNLRPERIDPLGDLSRSERMMLRSTTRAPRVSRAMSRVIDALP